uniref:Uncharacterized protein n=1 Tax=Clastoptera arizonana TaxID=38151 RepID=A0A1B6E626_9HEMI
MSFFYSIAVYKQYMISIIMSNTIYSKFKNTDLSSIYDAETDMHYMYIKKKKLGEHEESTNLETIKAVVVHRTADNPYDGIGPIPCKETQCKIRMAIIDKLINKICLHRIDGSPLYFVLCSGQNNKIIRNSFFSKQCNMFDESSGFFSQVCEVSQEAKDNLFKLVYEEHNYDSLNVIQEMIAYENSQENKNATIAESNNVSAVIINEFMDLTCSTVSTNVLKKTLHFDRLYTEACREKVLTYNNYFNKACKSATSPDSLSQYLCKDKQASINELRRVVFEDNKRSIFITINRGLYENHITGRALNNKWSYSKANRRRLGNSSINEASYLKPLVEDVFGRTCVYLLDGFALYFAICDVTTNAKMKNEFYFNKCLHSKDAADFVIKLCDVCEEAKENLIQIMLQEPGNSTVVVVKELQTCDNSRYPVMVNEEARSAILNESILTHTSHIDSLHRKNVIRKYSKFDLVEVLIQRICERELNGYALFFVLCGQKTNNITSKYYRKKCVTYRNPESFMRNLCDDFDAAKDNLLSVISKEKNFYTYNIIQELMSSNKGIRKPYKETKKMYYNSIDLYIEFYIETACKKPIERQPITLNIDFFYTESCKDFELIGELFLKRACQSSTDPHRFIQKLCKNEQTTVRQFKDLVFKGSKRILMKFIRERVDRYKHRGTSINERSLRKKKAKKSHKSIIKRSISQDCDAAKGNLSDVIFKEKVSNYEHTISKRSWKGMKRSKPISVYFTQDKLCKDSDDKTSSYVYNTICFTKPSKSIQYLDAICRRSRTFYEFIKVICSEENIFAVQLDKYIFEEGNHDILVPIVLPLEFAAKNVTAMSKTNNENIIRLTTFMNNVCNGKVNGVPFYNAICKDKKVDDLYIKLKCEGTRNSYMFFEEICKDQSQVVRQLYIITHEQKDFEISALVMDGIFTDKKSENSDPWTYINNFVKMMCNDGESVRPFYETICNKKHIKRHAKYFKNICSISREADPPAGTFLQHLCIDQKEATEEIYHAVYFIKMFDLLRLAKDNQDKLVSTINPTEVNNNPQEELGLFVSRLCDEGKYDSTLYDLLCQQQFDKNFYIDYTCKKRVTQKYYFKTVCKQRAKFINALYDLIYLRKIPGIMNILKSKYSPSCNGSNGKCNTGEIQIQKLFLEICSSVPVLSNEDSKRNFYNVLEKRFILYDILCDNVKPDDRYIFGAMCSVSNSGYEFLKKLCFRHNKVISDLYKYIYEDLNLEMVLILEDLPPCVDCEKNTLFIDSFVRRVCHDKHYSFEFFNKICKIKNPHNKYFTQVCDKSAYGLLSFYLKMCQDLEGASTALYDIIYKEQHFEIINTIKLRFPSRPPSQLAYKPKNNKKTCFKVDYCIPPYLNLQNYQISKGESNYIIGNEKDESQILEDIFKIPKNWTGKS